MGFKVDREAVATLVLPQLWAMSMGPCMFQFFLLYPQFFMCLSVLNLEQFNRFMTVIQKLSQRVEKEHAQFLRDSQRLEDRSTTSVSGSSGSQPYGGSVDFENLVGRANGASIKADTMIDGNKSWDNDIWGSIFNGDEVSDLTS